MALSSTSLPKPKNWQDFEYKTKELMACVLNDPNTQLNGRSGQKQNGVDIFGYRDGNLLVGIQCKSKFESTITEEELRSEVAKAKNFVPPLSEFIMVTTAPRDQKIQEVARIITRELVNTDHSFQVSVWGWEDVEETAAKYVKAWKVFDPTWNPFAESGLNKMNLDISDIKALIKELPQELMLHMHTQGITNFKDTEENTQLCGSINAFQKLIDDGYVRGALQQLQKLRDDNWAKANRTERYKILICIASAKLKLNDQFGAADLLIEAYRENPDHKNAKINLATGFLFKKDNIQAKELAHRILENDDSNEKAAGILIQTLINDTDCTNPLRHIPNNLIDSEEVLTAYIHFLRCRQNPDWIEIAKNSYKKYPDNRTLRLFFSEAIIDNIIQSNSDVVVGGIFHNLNFDEFNFAVETLYTEAQDAIDKGYPLPASIAHNAALALRLSNDIPRAKEILDISLRQCPDDEKLRLQSALIAYLENDPVRVLEILPNESSDPEMLGLIALSLTDLGKETEALAIIKDVDQTDLPEHIKLSFLSIRIRGYIAQEEKQIARELIDQQVKSNPFNFNLRTLQIKTYRMIGDYKGAERIFDDTLLIVDENTTLLSRLQLSFEAQKLSRYEVTTSLLKGKVSTDRENDGLSMLITASINSGLYVTASELLSSISQHLKEKAWFQKAEAIIALNIGDITAEEKTGRYLKQRPNDLEMILARIGILQRAGKVPDIRHYLTQINLSNIKGKPEQLIRLASIMCRYDEPSKGLEYGYSIIMDYWNVPQAHLAYQGLILVNENIEDLLPTVDTVSKNSVICLLTEDGERRYRIEETQHKFFENERISEEDDLAKLLIGKKSGDEVILHDRTNPRSLKVLWVKSIYLDALHKSMEQFNERFPQSDGLLRLKIDPESPDPLEDMREITKACAETNQNILDEYRLKGFPLSFVATLLGKDPVDTWAGLQLTQIKFRVCHGALIERKFAFNSIYKHMKKGCVLDAITLSLVHRLGIEDAIIEVCGPIHAPQSVIDLLVIRAITARQNVGKMLGYVSWYNGRLVYEEYTKETLNNIAQEREKEALWARNSVRIASSMPKTDLSKNIRKIIDVFENKICDAAIAADGNDLLLISDDMGFRTWAVANFPISATWLQPALIIALQAGHISIEKYCEAINTMVMAGHYFVSLNADCLMYQLRKDEFNVTNELCRLLEMIGGSSADLIVNSEVLGTFIDMACVECHDEFKIKKIVSEALSTFTNGRPEDLIYIIKLIMKQISVKGAFINHHSLDWLCGHSIGMPYFNDLLQKKKHADNMQ